MKLAHSRIALVGFRGVGKSSLAKELQNYFSALNICLDSYIENHEHMRIEEIVEKKGWGYFRKKEADSIRTLLSIEGEFILDTGGGIVEGSHGERSQEKIELLKKNFYCVYISIDDTELLKRLEKLEKNQQRVALPFGSLATILEKRKPWYQELADINLDITGLSLQNAAQKLAEILQQKVSKNLKKS